MSCKIFRIVTASQSLGFCSEIMEILRETGYDVCAISSPGPELDELSDKGFHCVAVPMERHISVVTDLQSLFHLIRIFRKEKPQVIHSMTPKAGLLSMVAGWWTGVPVRIHTFTGLVWPTSVGLKRQVLKLTDKITCASATHVIPESEGVMNDLLSGGITKKQMKVLGYGNIRGVDLVRFDPDRICREESEAFTFLFVGRIVRDKGINEFVEAFCRLNSEFTGTKLVLVGEYEMGLDPLKPQVMEQISNNPAINAVGQRRGEDLVREYANADCFVLRTMSLFREPILKFLARSWSRSSSAQR